MLHFDKNNTHALLSHNSRHPAGSSQSHHNLPYPDPSQQFTSGIGSNALSPHSSGLQTSNISQTSHVTNPISLKLSDNTLSHVLLFTACVDVLNNRHSYQPLRCLLESGSQCSVITLKAFHSLGLPWSEFVTEVNGLGSMKSCLSKGKVTLSIKPRDKSSPILSCDAIIIDQICDKMPAARRSNFH